MAAVERERKRLLRTLAGFLILLALPIGVIVWQAFDQLKFEAFYQYRNQAEALTTRIDARLNDAVREAEARGFADFSFLNVTDPANANILQRSALAAYPIDDDLPGVLGYFQIDADGDFSTPLLPADDAGLGIPPDEYALRAGLAQELRGILARNRLVPRAESAGRLQVGEAEAYDAIEEITLTADDDASSAPAPAAAAPPGDFATAVTAAEDASRERVDLARNNSQQAFDDLIPGDRPAEPAGGADADDASEQRETDRGLRLRDLLSVDEAYEKKSVALEQRQERPQAPARTRRAERAAVPETAPANDGLGSGAVDGETVRIATFESEIDPYYFRLLDSGHFVLFRRVWRDSQRYVQGLLIDSDQFVSAALQAEYRAATLANMSNMIVGYQGTALETIRGDEYGTYPATAGELAGTHLFSRTLSAPFDGIELLFTINRLPLGPGAGVLAWTSAAFAAVLALGFFSLYRLGISQIRVARQQQDFVSAVSHELKTPLTSIRLYGEMLREDWVEDDKRKQYYAYIHDEAERLTRLISNVLRLAKISRSEPQLEVARVPVGEALAAIEEKISSQIERAGFTLDVRCDDDLRERLAVVDRDALTQILINLVDNALKFSKDADHKTVELRCVAESDDTVSFRVRDYGPGIPKDQLKKIFVLFYRGESELTRETIGTGIGLAIVRELTVAMGGQIDVVNKDPGAEFRVSLPLAA